MSQDEQDAMLGRAVREIAEHRGELLALEFKLDHYSEVLASWSERVKARVHPGYTPRCTVDDTHATPSREELLRLLDECDSVRERLSRRKSQLQAG